MDNLGSHKIPGVREAIEAAGATLVYIPPYSPDLNPIEMVFAKIKSILRKKAIRTEAALWEELGREHSILWGSLRSQCDWLVVVRGVEAGIVMTEGVFERIVQHRCTHVEEGLHRRPVPASLSVILCAGHNQRQGGVLCRAEPKSWTAP